MSTSACAGEEKPPGWGSGGIEDDSLRISGQKDQHFKWEAPRICPIWSSDYKIEETIYAILLGG